MKLSHAMSRPAQHRQFDHLLICSPSGAVIDMESLDRGIQALGRYGLPVIEQPNTRRRDERFAGSNAERVAALNMGLGLSQSGLVMCSRGGYGLSRVLHALDLNALAGNCTRYEHLFCGHSDITSLQLALLAAGAPPSGLLHGPMVCFDFGAEQGPDAQTLTHFESAVFEGRVDVRWSLGEVSSHSAIEASEAEPYFVKGPVWGGNLSMLCSLLGTPYMPGIQGGILVMEDINEPYYKVERMLLQLLHSGVLAQQSALVLGDFGTLKPSAHDQGFGLASIIQNLGLDLQIPVFHHFPFGHCTPKACWFQGAEGKLSWFVDGELLKARLEQSIPPA